MSLTVHIVDESLNRIKKKCLRCNKQGKALSNQVSNQVLNQVDLVERLRVIL